MVEHIRLLRDFREVFGKRTLRRWDGNLLNDFPTLSGHRSGKKIPVVMAEGIVRKDHGHFFAEIARHPRRHRNHLRSHIGDARLKHVAIEFGRGHMIALTHHKVGHLEFACTRRRAEHHVREQCAESDVNLVLRRHFFQLLQPRVWDRYRRLR